MFDVSCKVYKSLLEMKSNEKLSQFVAVPPILPPFICDLKVSGLFISNKILLPRNPAKWNNSPHSKCRGEIVFEEKESLVAFTGSEMRREEMGKKCQEYLC